MELNSDDQIICFQILKTKPIAYYKFKDLNDVYSKII